MISICNYGIGNVQALANIYKRLNIPARIVSTVEELMQADKIILPGVGAFDWAMARLEKSGMRTVLDDLVLSKGRSVLGICVGMQMMARRSDEGMMPGLGWIDAEVKKFDRGTIGGPVYLPHMGWNDVEPCSTEGLFNDIETRGRFYFLHSYYFVPKDINSVLSFTDYSARFASSVRVGNVLGVQFHPEKSHHWGVQLLKNFAEI